VRELTALAHTLYLYLSGPTSKGGEDGKGGEEAREGRDKLQNTVCKYEDRGGT